MLSKSTLKYIRSLRQAKSRQKYHKIVVEGTKSVLEVLREGLLMIEGLYAVDSWIEANRKTLEASAMAPVAVADHELGAISAFTTPQHVLAVCEMPAPSGDLTRPSSALCLYLDGIRDPGNLGTIFRIADWFGLGQVYLSPDSVDPFNPKVIQASMSSLFRVPWSVSPLAGILSGGEVNAFMTTLDGENIYTADLPDKGLLIMGNEATGIRLTDDYPNLRRLSVPGDLALGADSLNVAVATGIICAEFRRRSVAMR